MYENRNTEYIVYDGVSLGTALQWFRESAGLTQQDLAERTGLHRPYLSRIEQGNATKQVDAVFRLVRRLGLEVVVRRRRTD